LRAVFPAKGRARYLAKGRARYFAKGRAPYIQYLSAGSTCRPALLVKENLMKQNFEIGSVQAHRITCLPVKAPMLRAGSLRRGIREELISASLSAAALLLAVLSLGISEAQAQVSAQQSSGSRVSTAPAAGGTTVTAPAPQRRTTRTRAAMRRAGRADRSQVVAEVGRRRITKAELTRELSRHVSGPLSGYTAEEQHQLRQKMLEMM